MRINEFFAGELSASLRNFRNSWGAVQKKTGHVILRVWDEDIDRRREPNDVLIQTPPWKGKSIGWAEREGHIASIRSGTPAFGVVCHKKKTADGRTKIGRFDSDLLLRLGRIVRRGDNLHIRILERIPVREIRSGNLRRQPFAKEAAALRRAGAKEKEVNAYIRFRIGQGRFRAEVLRQWRHRCCVTGSATGRAIRASHIKSWKRSTESECRDPHNGLPLIATLDALFDGGLISFADDGRLLVSKRISRDERELLGLEQMRMSRRPSRATAQYLKWHRRKTFKG